MGEIRRAHLVEDELSQPVSGHESLPRVVGNVISDLRARQPEGILEFRRQRYAVVRIRILLDQEPDPELPRNYIVQFVGQVDAKQRSVVLAELVEGLRIL